MITLIASAQSGYKQDFETSEEMLLAAAELLGVSVDEMHCIQCNGQDDRFYFYASEEEADADLDGSYAVQSTGAPLLEFIFTAGCMEETGNFETCDEAEARATYLAECWRKHVTVVERFDCNNTWVAEYTSAGGQAW